MSEEIGRNPEPPTGTTDSVTPPSLGKKSVSVSVSEAEEIKVENERIKQANKNLNAKIEEMEKKLEDLEESNISDHSSSNGNDVNKDLNDPQNARLVNFVSALSEEKAIRANTEYDISNANWLVIEESKKLGIEEKEFVEKLKPFASKFAGENISRFYRNKLAIDAYHSEQARIKSLEERERKVKEFEDKEKLYAETGSRVPREDTLIGNVEKLKADNAERKGLVAKILLNEK